MQVRALTGLYRATAKLQRLNWPSQHKSIDKRGPESLSAQSPLDEQAHRQISLKATWH